MIQAFINNINDFNIGESISISLSNSSHLRCDLAFYIRNDQSGQYDLVGRRTDVTDRYQLEFSQAEIEQMEHAVNESPSSVFKVDVDSYDGSIYIGSHSTSCLARVIDANPFFASDQITFEDINPLTLGITNDKSMIIRYLSQVRINFGEATAIKGAYIRRYEIYFGGSQELSVTTAGTHDIGDITQAKGKLLIRAVDSRYNIAEISVEMPVTNYYGAFPTVNIKRQFNYEAETHIYPDVDFPSVNGLNKIDIVYRMREVNGEFGAEIPIENRADTVVQLDQNKVFEFEFKTTDVFGKVAQYSYFVGKGVFPMFIDTTNNSVGINTFPEQNDAMRVAGGWMTAENGMKVEIKSDQNTLRAFYNVDGIESQVETNVNGEPTFTSGGFKIVADYFEIYRNVESVTPILEGGDDGGDFLRSVPTYNRTYAESPNMFITSYGTFGRSTSSSIRYKDDIKDIKDDDGFNPEMLLKLPIKTYRYKPEFEPIDKPSGTRYAGFIAEDVAKLYPPATEYNENGEVEMWSIKDIIPPMLALIQANYKEIESLKREIQKLKGGDAK